MKKLGGLILLIILGTAHFAAASVTFSINTERTTVTKGEQVTLIATLVSPKSIGSADIPSPAPNEAFELLSVNRSQSQSSQIQVINGQIVQKNEIQYRFIYTIVPAKNGTFTFPSLEITLDGATYKTQPVTFNVTDQPVNNADIRAYLLLNKKVFYPGEQAILTLKIAQKINAPIQTQRGYTGAIEKLEAAFGKEFSLNRLFTNQVTTGQERINGELYNTFTLKYSVFGVTAGEFSIPSVPFQYDEIRRTSRRRIDPFFSDFFDMDPFGGTEAVTKTVYTNPLNITVNTLPSPPQGFAGTVGRVSLSATVDPVTVQAGEALTLRITLKGNTRATNMGDPILPELKDCDVFTPERQSSSDTSAEGFSTRKTYRYLIIPKQEGSLSLGPITYPYFDAESGSFKTAKSDQLTINVTPGKGGPKEQTRYLTQEEVRQVGQDIRYIKTDKPVHQHRRPYRQAHWFLLFPLPFLIGGFAFIYRFHSGQTRKNANRNIRQKALRLALKELDKLRKESDSLSNNDFLGKAAITIEKYISQKFGFAATGRTLEELKAELLSRKIDAETVGGLAELIERNDEYRFGGKPFNKDGRKDLLEKIATFLTSMEKTVLKKPVTPVSAAILLILALMLPTFSTPVDSWFEKANAFYAKGNYDSAHVYYSKITDSGINSSTVLFNLGNTCFRQKKLGLAKLYYEKAALVSPKDQDIQANIRFVNSMIVDRVDSPLETDFLTAIFYNLHTMFSLNQQIFILFFLLLAISLLISAILFKPGLFRIWATYGTVLLSLLFLAVSLSAGYKIHALETKQFAVILTSSLDAKNQPQGTQLQFTAHEGTKVRILKTIDDWSLISLPNGASGWVKNNSLGLI